MADSKAPRMPTVTAVADTEQAGAQMPPDISLPAETVVRWQQIVRQALSGGREISALVQQYAEQSFNTKLGGLDTQGARRRMLARAHAALERERTRAEEHLAAQPSVKPPIMTRAFQAHVLEVPGPQEAPPAPQLGRSDKKIDIEWHHTTKPVDDPYTKRTELEAHVQTLTEQMQAIDKELPAIDAVLNRGLRNQQNVVTELAAVSRELYRLAQEVRAELPQKAAPIDGTGYQKSTRKKPQDPTPSAAAPDVQDAQDASRTAATETDNPEHPGPKTPAKTVPINPLGPVFKSLGRLLGQAAAKTGELLHPVGVGIAKGAGAIAAVLSAIFGGIGRTISSVTQAIADAWPWRGPPPG